jgi:mannitol/fructose-specific phosphotransferase system IIA component (Ntr-type)
MARNLNPKLKIFVRARYLRDREELDQVGATAAIFEEAEAAVALARLVLADTGAGRELIEHAMRDIRMRLILDNVSTLRTQVVRRIMVPWTRVRRLSNSAGLDEVRRQVGEQHFSRWPVVEAETGMPIGYLLAKDLIGLKSDGAAWTNLVRSLVSVQADDDIESTLLRFQREGFTMCAVRDGQSPVGIVTIEDILGQVIGRLEDEYPRRPKVNLRDLVLTDGELLDLKGRTADQVIVEMAGSIPANRLPPGADIAELAIAREREMPTDVGFGVAIPHARCPSLAAPLMVIGRSAEGIQFNPQSTDRVHLIFLLVTPAEQPDLQIHLLSQIARIVGNPECRSRLLAALSAAEVAECLADEGNGG